MLEPCLLEPCFHVAGGRVGYEYMAGKENIYSKVIHYTLIHYYYIIHYIRLSASASLGAHMGTLK